MPPLGAGVLGDDLQMLAGVPVVDDLDIGREGLEELSVIDRRIGDGTRGPVTRVLQETYFDAVHGREPKYRDWLAPL